jgi:hypothetical protein
MYVPSQETVLSLLLPTSPLNVRNVIKIQTKLSFRNVSERKNDAMPCFMKPSSARLFSWKLIISVAEIL